MLLILSWCSIAKSFFHFEIPNIPYKFILQAVCINLI